jgi:outer membrane receptor for ferrienterochelin and colicins
MGVPAGEHAASASAIGHFSVENLIFRLTGGGVEEVEIVLPLRAVVNETVVVTGTRTPHLLIEAPVRTDIVSQDLTDRQVKTNLSEMLTATVSGIRIENNCQNCGFTQIRLNGLEGAYTQILEDGLPTFSGVTGIYGLEQIPVEFVENVEIVKGGTSALYGPNAVAGVVNLIRREPTVNGLRLDVLSGVEFNRPEHQVGTSGQLVNLPGDFGADFYFRGVRKAHIDRTLDGFTDRVRREGLAGGATFYRRFFDGRAGLTFGGSGLSEFRRGGSQLDLPPDQTFVTEQLDSVRSAGFARWNHAVSPETFYALSTSFALLDRDSYYGADFDPNAFGSTRNPLSASDFQLGHTAGKHTILVGGQYWWEHVTDVVPSYNRAFDQTFTNTGFYFQDEIRLANNITVLGGARVDKSNVLDHWVFNPRGNIRIGLGSSWNLRFGVSTGFRAPQIFDEDLHIAAVGGEGFVVSPGEGLEEERSLSFTGSLDYTALVNGKPLQVGATVFRTNLRNVFVFEEVDDPELGFRQLFRVNGDNAHVQGVQFDLNWNLTSRIVARGGMTIQEARFSQPEPQFGSRRFFRTPNEYGFAGLDIDFPGQIDFSTTMDFTGSMIAPHFAGFIPEDRLETTPQFFVLNLVIGKTISLPIRDETSMRIYFLGRNLTDSFQDDLDLGPLRDVSYFYGPIQMRTVMGGVTFRF